MRRSQQGDGEEAARFLEQGPVSGVHRKGLWEWSRASWWEDKYHASYIEVATFIVCKAVVSIPYYIVVPNLTTFNLDVLGHSQQNLANTRWLLQSPKSHSGWGNLSRIYVIRNLLTWSFSGAAASMAVCFSKYIGDLHEKGG